MGQFVKFKFFIDGAEINAPVDWQSIQILASFDQSSVQANISTEEFEFVNEAAQVIRRHIAGGADGSTNGIFEGLPFSIIATDGVTDVQIFEGHLDFTSYEEITPVRVRCGIRKNSGLNQLDERTRANSFGYLRSLGLITPADYVDVPYVIQKVNTRSEAATLSLSIFLITFQILKEVNTIAKDGATSTAITATAGLGSAVAGPAHAAATLALSVFYVGLLIIQLAQLLQELVNLLVPPVNFHKGIRLHRLMEIAVDYLGYTYDSPLDELDNLVYVPSKPFDDQPILEGIPRASDYGYTLAEAFEMINLLTNSRVQVDGTTLIQRSLNDSFWLQSSTYQVPDVLDERIKYNTEELNARIFINFLTDASDEWTIEEFTGTNYEVIISPITGGNNETNLMKGFTEISIPLALGKAKTELNAIEFLINELFLVIDQGFAQIPQSVLGSTQVPQLSQNFLLRLGALKVSEQIHTVPKLVYLDSNGKIPYTPTPQTDLFSARVLWEKYYNYISFVSNDFGYQRRIFESKRIPFGFSDFLATEKNSYFITEDGRTGKIESLKWTLNSDTAEADYWISEIYTRNLKEEFIEG